MSGPTLSEVHLNRPLTNMMISWAATQDVWNADKFFPICPVLKKSDKYFVVEKDMFFTAGAKERAPGTESVGMNYHVTTDDYNAKVYSAHYDLPEQTRANYDTPLAADASAMRFVTRIMFNTRELHFYQRYLQEGVWSGANPTGSSVNVDYDVKKMGNGYWDADDSDPLADIQDLLTYIEGRTGFRPNKLGLSADVYNAASRNKSLLDKIKYTQRGVMTKDLLASLFGVDELVIFRLPLNQSQSGRTSDINYVLKNKFFLGYAPKEVSITEPSCGYIFPWTGYLGAGALGNTMSQIPHPLRKSDRFEGEMAYDMKACATDLGVLGVNVLGKYT